MLAKLFGDGFRFNINIVQGGFSMKKSMGWIVIIGIIVLLIFMFIGYSNGFKAASIEVDSQLKQVDNMLLRRHDLIPNLVNTVKGYAKHEKEIFTNLNNARNQLMQANTLKEKAAAEGNLESALGRLLMVVENYPNLKANEQFNKLMDELAGTENRLAVERKRYNDLVRDYNKKIAMLPGSIIAGMMGLTPREYFEVPQTAKENPTVDFNE
jgi:LemA protein